VTFASIAALVVALVVALGLGLHQTGETSGQGSGVSVAEAAPEKVSAASPDHSFSSPANSGTAAARDAAQSSVKDATKNPPQSLPSAMSSPAVTSEANMGNSPKEQLPVAKPTTAPAISSAVIATAKPQRKSADDLVARDTVTYLDKSFDHRVLKKSTSKSKPAKPVAARQPRPKTRPRRDGIVAANRVTYLNDKPVSKPSK
jgi:hypothetical protein